jgi:hypothetical protein
LLNIVKMASEEEDDYMTMALPTAAPTHETSFQRRQREKREALERGTPKSKAALAAEAAAKRDDALATSLLAGPRGQKSKGLSMMKKMGFSAGGRLGAADNDSTAEPLRIRVREGREGIGVDGVRKRALDEAATATAGEDGAKRARREEDPEEYRARAGRERDEVRTGRLVGAAQGVAERLEEEKEGRQAAAARARPLKSVNVLWRGVVRAREEAERDRRMRRDLEDSLSRLPTYEDDEADEDDRTALGRGKKVVYAAADDLDEEDPELEEFEALEAREKLRRLVEHLRKEHRYCFWCKFAYPDEAMEGCPGLTEEEHD